MGRAVFIPSALIIKPRVQPAVHQWGLGEMDRQGVGQGCAQLSPRGFGSLHPYSAGNRASAPFQRATSFLQNWRGTWHCCGDLVLE